MSVFGAVGCGKSYFLAAMTWELRQILPKHFLVGFQDIDSDNHGILIENEKTLFNNKADVPVPLADLIAKTAIAGDLNLAVLFQRYLISMNRF